MFPIIFSALSLFCSPSFIEIFAVAPIPINIEKANTIVTIGIVIPTPVIAKAPISSIFPIKILSTTLYRALTSILIIAGIEYFISNFLMSPLCRVNSCCFTCSSLIFSHPFIITFFLKI